MFIDLRSKASTRLMVPLPIGLTARFSLGLFSRTMRWSSRDCNLAMNSRSRGRGHVLHEHVAKELVQIIQPVNFPVATFNQTNVVARWSHSTGKRRESQYSKLPKVQSWVRSPPLPTFFHINTLRPLLLKL